MRVLKTLLPVNITSPWKAFISNLDNPGVVAHESALRACSLAIRDYVQTVFLDLKRTNGWVSHYGGRSGPTPISGLISTQNLTRSPTQLC